MAVILSALAGAGQQFFDNNGVILSGGKLYTYAAGTTMPQTTYTSVSGLTAHTNPIILNSAGRVATGEIWVTVGETYKFVLKTSADVTLVTWDNITGINGTGIASNASSVTYDPPYANSVATTVENKLAETVSVKDFGAVGNGAADDTVAINNAIEALGAQGGTVYFPPGTYMVRKYTEISPTLAIGVVLKSNITLAGAGVNASIIKGLPNAGTMHMVGNAVAGQSNIMLRDLTLDHNGTNINATAGVHCLRFNEVRNVWIQRIAVKNSDHHGIVTVTSGNDTSTLNNTFFVSDVYCENIGVSSRNGGDAIRLFYGADKITINNVICNGIEYHGVHVGKGRGTVSNVQMFNCGNVGLELQSEGVLANNIHIEWNDVISDLLANRPAAGTMGRLFWASDVADWYRDNGVTWKSLSGNLTGVWAVIRGAGYDPIQRLSLSNIKCILNVVQNTPYIPTTGDGVRISGKTVQLNNIHVAGLFRFGLLTDDDISDYLQVSNMTIDGVRSDGIRLDNIDQPRLSNVAILSAGTQGGTQFGINLRGTQNTRIMSSFINDSSLTQGIQESLATETGTKLVASHFTKSGVAATDRFNSALYCSGFITDASGTATVLSSQTSVVVTHGLSTTPTAANLTVIARSSDVHGNLWVSNITSTQFTINVTTAPSGNLALSWSARPV
jgi:hypothetical protein